MRRLLLTLIVVTSLFELKLQGQDAEHTYLHAMQLMEENQIEEAIGEFRRLLFFADTTYPDAYSMIGDCYRQLDETEKAIYYYRLAIKKSKQDSLRTENQFHIISSYLQALKPGFAKMGILTLPDTLSAYFDAKRDYYLFVTHYQLKEFDLSKSYFFSAIDKNGTQNDSVDYFFTKALKNDGFNVNLPMFLSIVPGLGQLYIGEYEAALNSLLLTGAVVTLYISSLEALTYLDAFLMVLPWMHRYYQGGMLNAKRLAELKKELRDGEIFNSLLDEYKKLKSSPAIEIKLTE